MPILEMMTIRGLAPQLTRVELIALVGLLADVESECPCDPDITSGQIKAWDALQAFVDEKTKKD